MRILNNSDPIGDFMKATSAVLTRDSLMAAVNQVNAQSFLSPSQVAQLNEMQIAHFNRHLRYHLTYLSGDYAHSPEGLRDLLDKILNYVMNGTTYPDGALNEGTGEGIAAGMEGQSILDNEKKAMRFEDKRLAKSPGYRKFKKWFDQ